MSERTANEPRSCTPLKLPGMCCVSCHEWLIRASFDWSTSSTTYLFLSLPNQNRSPSFVGTTNPTTTTASSFFVFHFFPFSVTPQQEPWAWPPRSFFLNHFWQCWYIALHQPPPPKTKLLFHLRSSCRFPQHMYDDDDKHATSPPPFRPPTTMRINERFVEDCMDEIVQTAHCRQVDICCLVDGRTNSQRPGTKSRICLVGVINVNS